MATRPEIHDSPRSGSRAGLTPSELSRTASRIYQDAPFGARLFQTYRPYICPFEQVLPWIPENGRILDVGCGAGLLLMLASELQPIEGCGVDTSEPAIAVAQLASRSSGGRREKHVPKFSRTSPGEPLPEGRFDAVCLIDVLHHVPPAVQKDFVEHVCSRVIPGGLLIYKDMCESPSWRAMANRLHDLVVAHEWIHYRSVREVESWCQGFGFELTHSEDLTRFWYGHELRVFRKVSGT